MTDENQVKKLAENLTIQLSLSSPADIGPLIQGFNIAAPDGVTQAVNLLILKDPRYNDAIQRYGAWRETYNRVSWSHTSPDVERLMRAAAAWRSSPLSVNHARNWAPEPWTRDLAGHSAYQTTCQTASETLGNRAFLNKGGGVSLNAGLPEPWPEDIQNLIDAGRDFTKTKYIVLCQHGRVIKGLPTWPRS